MEHYLKGALASTDMGFDVQFPDDPGLSVQQLNQLFRIVQEACTNTMRHAQAQQIEITGTLVAGGLEVRVEDDGRGFARADIRPGALGLAGMEERAALMGAQLQVGARTGGGTQIVIRIAHGPQAQEHMA